MKLNLKHRKSSWLTKFFLSFLAIVGIVNASLFIIAPLLPIKLAQFILPAGLIVLLVAFLFSIGFSIFWHNKDIKGALNLDNYTSWLVVLLRYWIAFLVINFGFQKIFGVNFEFSNHGNDSLVSTLSGQELTWNYYGYSFGISVIIALFQIGGGILLLFRRTNLLGSMVLLPVMLNIVLINIFYGIGPITLFTSVIISLGLVYLLYQQRVNFISFFNQYKYSLPVVGSKLIRGIAKIFCILIPCFFILYYRYDVHRSEKYFGKWKVEKLMRNGKIISDTAWHKDSLAWKNIYFEERGDIYFCPNPIMYIDSTSILMKYIYNESKNTLKVLSYEKNPKNPDTILVQIKQFDKQSMQWNMIFYQDTIEMRLKKVRRK